MKHPTAYRWAGVAFLVAAGVAAVMIRRPNGEPPAKAAPDADVSTRGGEEGGAADGLELGRARERIAALEQELERMRAAQARTEALLAELKPIAEMLKDARSGGALDAPDPDEKAFAAAMMGPRTASDLLNLDPARRQEFKRAFDEAVGQIRSLERSRARVSEDGAKTRIEVPAFAPEAEAVYAGWLQWARGFFTPQEREMFNAQRMFEGLFGFKRGMHDRVILVERLGDGTVRVHDTDAGGSSGRFTASENEGLMMSYAHLLRKP